MKKGNIISILMVVIAIIAAGYLYGDKIANKIGIDLHLHKPKAQVEETIDKQDAAAKESKPVETASSPTSKPREQVEFIDGYHPAVYNFLNAKCNSGFTFKDALNVGMKEWTVKYEDDGYVRLSGKTNPTKFEPEPIVIKFKTNDKFSSFDPQVFVWLKTGKTEDKGFAREYWSGFCKDAYNRSH